MEQIISSAELRGFFSGEVSFRAAYDRASATVPGFQQQFDEEMLFPLSNLIYDSARTGTLLIIGRADRVDEPGFSREQIREQEYGASNARSDSAFADIYQLVYERFGDFPIDWKERVHTMAVPTGAAILVNSWPDLSEPDRQQNRRVTLALVQFVPE